MNKGRRALTKWTLSDCTVLIASVRPCRNALVIAGSYVHSILPGHQTGGMDCRDVRRPHIPYSPKYAAWNAIWMNASGLKP